MEIYSDQYNELIHSLSFDEADMDYTLLDKHKPMLSEMARVANSGIAVFDLYRREHLFITYNFEELFGFNRDGLKQEGNEYFDKRVHPDDFKVLMRNGVCAFKYILAHKEKCKEYKFINEYRIRNKERKYIRVIEQHQILEVDKRGNPWLSISVWDVSPDQSPFQGVRTHMLNCRTGENYSLHDLVEAASMELLLSTREVEILKLVKEGLLSKEISDKLCISVHTVNTHRQKILMKLNANNSMEAIRYASCLGLLS